eukprot:3590512-Rhodomonas_salina.1
MFGASDPRRRRERSPAAGARDGAGHACAGVVPDPGGRRAARRETSPHVKAATLLSALCLRHCTAAMRSRLRTPAAESPSLGRKPDGVSVRLAGGWVRCGRARRPGGGCAAARRGGHASHPHLPAQRQGRRPGCCDADPSAGGVAHGAGSQAQPPARAAAR